MQSIYILQLALIITGLIFSFIVAAKLIALLPPEKVAPAFFRHLPLIVIAIVFVILF